MAPFTAASAADRLLKRLAGLKGERARLVDYHVDNLARLDVQIQAVEAAIVVLTDAKKGPIADGLLQALDQAGLKVVVQDR